MPAGALTLITLTLGLLCSTPAISDERSPGDFTFDPYEIVTGSTTRPAVVTGHLLGGAMAEIAVVDIDEKGSRRLNIYEFDKGGWVPRLDVTLRPDVLFVDVASIGGRDRLLSYSPGRLNWFDPETSTESSLLAVTSSFDPPRKNEIPHVELTRDLNGDDRDDLVVPDTGGFLVFIQIENGAFADPVKVGLLADMSGILGADGYRYDPWSQSRIHEIDYNHDGRNDLVFWSADHFEVHLQNERGLFGQEAEKFTTDVAFDSDDLSALAMGEMTGRVLHSLTDLNGDGVGDLVVHSLAGSTDSKKRSAYEVHFGARTPSGGTAFASEVGVTFKTGSKVVLQMEPHDFDGDVQPGVMLTTIDVRFLEASFWKKLKGFMGDSIGLELEFYRADAGVYADNANTTRGIGLSGAPDHQSPGWVPLGIVLRGGTHESRNTHEGWPRAFNTNLLIGDVTGDGRSDLLIEGTFRGLNLFAGVPGPELFAREAQNVSVIVPHDGEYSWLVDLNKDGKQDILMHHPFSKRDVHGAPTQPPGTERHRLTILIAR